MAQPSSSLINGRETELFSVRDRGLSYGDGVFETLAVRNGRILHWERHLRRLRRGCERLGIVPPDAEALLEEAQGVCDGTSRAVVKIIVTRGAGGRGYRPPPAGNAPTRIVTRYDWPESAAQGSLHHGVRATVCRTRLARNPRLAGIKHLNRLEQVLARSEWGDEYGEGLMLDTEGHPVEGTMSNLFLTRGAVLTTSDLAQAGVAGIARERILEIAPQMGIEVQVRELEWADLERTDGLFFCNSLLGIRPVCGLDERPYEISPLVARLQEALFDS